MTDVQATFSLTSADYVHAGRAILHRKRGVRAAYMFMVLCGVIFAAANLSARGGPRYVSLAMGLGGVVAVAFLIWFSPWLHVLTSLKNHTQAFASQTWVFGPAGARVETEASKAQFEWSVVLRASEHPKYLFLFVSDAMAYAIPKRALSAEAIAALKGGLRSWLGERAELRGLRSQQPREAA